MNIALIGPGAIGSTLAFQLATAGHAITIIARGTRLKTLQEAGAIVRADGARAPITVCAQLDEGVAYDLLLVTVLAPQVTTLLPSLRRSAARRVMFLFNTFEPLTPLRDAVGPARFAFGFPAGIFCLLKHGRIHPQIRSGTTVDAPELATLFTAAGIPTTVEPDMHSWLRTHAALVVPLMSLGVLRLHRGAGASWSEARTHALAFRAGFSLVRQLGHPWRPANLGGFARLPLSLLTGLLWALSRTRLLRELGELGPAEARMLIDMMAAAAPADAAPLLAIRPAAAPHPAS